MDSVRCPQCHKTFACTGDSGCWCFEMNVSPAVLEEMRRLSEDCYCPECLKEAALKMEKTNL